MNIVSIPSCAAWINSTQKQLAGAHWIKIVFYNLKENSEKFTSFKFCWRNNNHIISLPENSENPFHFHFSKYLMFPSLRSLRSSSNISHIWTKQKLSLLRHLFIRKCLSLGFVFFNCKVGVSVGRNISAKSLPRHIFLYHSQTTASHQSKDLHLWIFIIILLGNIFVQLHIACSEFLYTGLILLNHDINKPFMVQCSEMPMNHQREQCRKQCCDEEHYIGFTPALENTLLSCT